MPTIFVTLFQICFIFTDFSGKVPAERTQEKREKRLILKKWVLTSGISGYVVTWKFQLVNPWPLNISRAHATTLEHQRCKLMIPTLAYFDTALESSCKVTRLCTKITYTVKLGIKELLNKEQIGFKELFYTINLLLNKELLTI